MSQSDASTQGQVENTQEQPADIESASDRAVQASAQQAGTAVTSDPDKGSVPGVVGGSDLGAGASGGGDPAGASDLGADDARAVAESPDTGAADAAVATEGDTLEEGSTGRS